MTWILTLTLIHLTSVDVIRVRLPADVDCQSVGRAWVAMANAREGQTDIALFHCDRRPA
jgi:hypothetical protein